MKKFKISPNASVQTAEQIKQKFERLAANVGANGLTPNFQYAIISGAYDTKSGINPQTNKPVDYAVVKSVKIGNKSNKVNGIADLSINSLKRTVNVDEQTVDVIDFTAILPDCSELNALQILESLPEDKVFAVVPNGAVVSSTNFDSTLRPRQLYKCIELIDAAVLESVVNTANDAGFITFEEPTEEEPKPKK